MPFYMYQNDPSICALCGDAIVPPSFELECFTLNKRHPHYLLAGSATHSECLARYPAIVGFLEFYFSTIHVVFLQSFWALVPVGDDFADSYDSTLCQVAPPEYDCQLVIETLVAIGATFQPANAGECRLLWESDSEAIEYIFNAENVWRGAEVTVQCQPDTFLQQWRNIHARFDKVFLHNCTF